MGAAARWNGGRTLRRVVAGLAISDVAYRLLMREPLRRALGISSQHA